MTPTTGARMAHRGMLELSNSPEVLGTYFEVSPGVIRSYLTQPETIPYPIRLGIAVMLQQCTDPDQVRLGSLLQTETIRQVKASGRAYFSHPLMRHPAVSRWRAALIAIAAIAEWLKLRLQRALLRA